MSGTVISKPTARNFNEVIKAVSILEESNSVLKSRLENVEKENEMLTDTMESLNKDLKFLQNGMKKYYDNLSNDIKKLSDEIGVVLAAVGSIGLNQKNHDAMNYDIMKKMLVAQESMFTNVVSLLEAHSIIDKADNAINFILQTGDQDDDSEIAAAVEMSTASNEEGIEFGDNSILNKSDNAISGAVKLKSDLITSEESLTAEKYIKDSIKDQSENNNEDLAVNDLEYDDDEDVDNEDEEDDEEGYEREGCCPLCGAYIEIDSSMIDEDGDVECPECGEFFDIDDLEDEWEGYCPLCGEYIEIDSSMIYEDGEVECPECGEYFNIADFEEVY